MPDSIVTRKTSGEIRSFLDELANGTSRYRSLHNLTEQVEHQYHGRFLVELIQNAHDALDHDEKKKRPQRIEISILQDGSPFGALYIANDGKPFTQSNFDALSNLGQSDKDPQKSIGNKGIGFRSVLEICEAPQVFSRANRDSSTFDGFCFQFQPSATQLFLTSIERLIEGDDAVESPIVKSERLVDWDHDRHRFFRDKYQSASRGWLREELKLLSPYVLPLPIENINSLEAVADYEQAGFSTLVRLPFINDEARLCAEQKLSELNHRTLLFLDRLDSLHIICDSRDVEFFRTCRHRPGDTYDGREIEITTHRDAPSEPSDGPVRYWLWTRTVGGATDPDGKQRIKISVADLPGRWPDLEEATVSLAVPISDHRQDGVLSIYLPTNVSSGSGANLSAPFFGDMSRTDVDFDEPYNRLLLDCAATLAVDTVFSSLTGNDVEDARAIIDLLAPSDDDQGALWWEALTATTDERDVVLEHEPILLSDRGWDSLARVVILPDCAQLQLIDHDTFRSASNRPALHQSLVQRQAAIRRLYELEECVPHLADTDFAETLETIAQRLHSKNDATDWTAFWIDVQQLGVAAHSLVEKTLLLGTDNKLHASDDRTSVFFRPRTGGSDDEIETQSNVSVQDIPETLRPCVAFLHESIRVTEPGAKGGIRATAVQQFLADDLVETYGVERIFASVLTKTTPTLPIKRRSREADLCRDILRWALKLLLVSKGSRKEPIRLLGQLPAPCVGGWYPVAETSFGPGWSNACGSDLDRYLKSADTLRCKELRKRILLPPDHPIWDGLGALAEDILQQAGAFPGLRLVTVDPDDWSSQFEVSGYLGLQLPEAPPPGYTAQLWGDYVEYLRSTNEAHFSGSFNYQFQELVALPGAKSFDELESQTRGVLSRLILNALPEWGNQWTSWTTTELKKISGDYHSFRVDSPLKFLLRHYDWMHGEVNGEPTSFSPEERWFIPLASIAGGRHQFAHLDTVPPSISSTLSRDSALVESLEELGLPVYDPDSRTPDPRLLVDLAAALADRTNEISNTSVFLGQVRTAWAQFYPDDESEFPGQLIVRVSGGPPHAVLVSEEDPIFLPDADHTVHEALDIHGRPVIAIDTRDAQRLREELKAAYGAALIYASELTTQEVIDGERDQKDDEAPLLADEIRWLPIVVLSIFAHHGQQSRGTSTRTFAQAIETLRRARVRWVETLETSLSHENKVIARTTVPALWSSASRTLLATSQAKKNLSALSDALAAAVDRSDIDTALRLALSNRSYDEIVHPTDAEELLRQLRITPDHVREVYQRWLGDFASLLRTIRPIVRLLDPKAHISILDQIANTDELRHFLEKTDLTPLDADSVVSIAQTEMGLLTVGERLWEELGDRAQLSEWNEALVGCGERPVSNEEAHSQFEQHREQCAPVLRSLAAAALRKDPTLGGYQELEAQLADAQCPEWAASRVWQVEFPHFMAEIHAKLAALNCDNALLDAVNQAKSISELEDRLCVLNIVLDLDPIEVQAENQKTFSAVVESIQNTAIAWSLVNNAETTVWENLHSSLLGYCAESFAKDIFLRHWNEASCIQLIRIHPRTQEHGAIWTVLDCCKSVAEVAGALGLSETDLEQARGQLAQAKRDREQRKKIVDVCGVEFVNDPDNLPSLWDHIAISMDDECIQAIALSSIHALNVLEGRKKRPARKKERSGGTKSRGRQPQAMRDLIGLAGEIHAYRALQKVYGTKSVTPSSWKSENSRWKFPQNDADDGYGCDFVISAESKTYYIEVKATAGEDESFELGSSEIEMAIDLANRGGGEFVVLHVLNALSSRPRFRVLPNPYDRGHKDKYRFEEAGLRVRYSAPEPGQTKGGTQIGPGS